MTFFVLMQLLHLCESVEKWGPLWAHSCFSFEAGNGKLTRVIRNAKGIPYQISRHLSLRRALTVVENSISLGKHFKVTQFFESLCMRYVPDTFTINGVRCFGSPKKTSAYMQHLNLQQTHCLSYDKIVKKGCLYTSICLLNKRTDNSYIKLTDDSFARIVKFIRVWDSELLVIVKKLNLVHELTTMPRQFSEYCSESAMEVAYRTDEIQMICVKIESNGKTFVCPITNLLHY